MDVSSADPDTLERYASAGHSLNDSLRKQAQALDTAYRAYSATASECRADVSAALSELAAYVDRNRRDDEWVRTVAAAFRKADTGAGPVTLDDARITALLRSAGLPVSRSQEDWQRLALKRAGIDPADWDPEQGLLANDEIVQSVYRYYGQLWLDHPELQWAGMANLVGPMFYAGWQDLYGLRHALGSGNRLKYFAILLDLPQLPGWVYRTAGFFGPGPLAEHLTSEELEWFEVQFLKMQKAIFEDLAWQHEAYLSDGIEEMRRLRRAGKITGAVLLAWEDIASGEPARLAAGNKALLQYEQETVIQDEYDEMRRHHGPVGDAFTYLATWTANNSVPGGKPYRDVVTRTIGAEIHTPRLPLLGLDPPDPGVHVTLPRGNIAEFDDRWEWIRNDMLPAYQELLKHPGEMRALVNRPVADRADDARRLDVLPYPR
ncbi:MAG: hypothetical protein ACRD0K_19240 [Egibacteraceae bacterium]